MAEQKKGHVMKKVKTIFIVATCIALASQVNINLFFPGFIISLSVILRPYT